MKAIIIGIIGALAFSGLIYLGAAFVVQDMFWALHYAEWSAEDRFFFLITSFLVIAMGVCIAQLITI